MIILGIDLSGPRNTDDTVLVKFADGKDRLHLAATVVGAGDEEIFRQVEALPREEKIIAGLDAPLSYNPGGGFRDADKALQKRLISAGLPPGSVMPPTLIRMVYLTLRGVTVARLLESPGKPDLAIVEVHPGAALVLGGCSVADVKYFKGSLAARQRVLGWLEGKGLEGVASPPEPGDHYVAACACALAAWKWARGNPAWLWKANPPCHPYDFSC